MVSISTHEKSTDSVQYCLALSVSAGEVNERMYSGTYTQYWYSIISIPSIFYRHTPDIVVSPLNVNNNAKCNTTVNVTQINAKFNNLPNRKCNKL